MNAVAWAPRQRRLLAAMGYTLYRRVADTAAPGGDPALPGQADAAWEVPDRHDPLLPALLRAAGQGLDGDALTAWAREIGLPPLARLREDPAAKRGLWRRLRRWRGERAGR